MRFLLGPAAFAVICLLPVGELPRSGQLALATFVWALLWWITQPVPWGIAVLLPLIIFPAFGVMNIAATASLYGQSIFFWVWGLALLGYAMQKHGLGKRFAIGLLSVRGIATTTHRLLFFYMLTTCILSIFITDSAVVAMMIPIGISIVSYVRNLAGTSESNGCSSLAKFIALGTLYGAMAGGFGTIAGAPPNAVAATLLENLTGETISWFRWMKLGVPLGVFLVVIYYFLLKYFFPPELTNIPGGQEFIRNEAKKLGKMNQGEKNVLCIFVAMVLLFTAPSIAPFLLGSQSPITLSLRQALSIWTVPPIILFMLFALPKDIKKGEFTLMWRDVVEHTPWNVMLLLTGAVAMTEAMSRFGFVDFAKGGLAGFGITSFTLPIIAAFAGGVMTQLASGTATTALLANLFIPVAVNIGFNAASIAVLLSNVAIGIVLPWGGAPAAVAFASGEIDIKDMIRVGLLAEVILVVTVALVHLLVAPVF
ncbi:MAG: DASS family sodium-coupled anion symporter [Acidobacteria bacterium]|nr:DASS family sodium-coupled anion symporter [Acidobacteriota bacterium]